MSDNIQTTSEVNGSSSGIDFTPVVNIYPEDYNFFHQFGSSASLPSQAMNVSYENATNVSVQIEITYLQGNGWITIPPVDSYGNTQVSVDPTGFAVGNYSAEIRAKLIDNSSGDVVATSSPAVVRLSISDADFLSIIPTAMIFSHMLGETIGGGQQVQLDSSLNWTVSIDTNAYPDVLDVTPSSGNSGSSQSITIALNSNINNESVGQLQIPVVFSAGSLTQTLNVTINIEKPSGGFSVAPNTINIEWLRGSALPDNFHINVFSDDDWEITSKPSWLYINQMTGNTSVNLEGNVIGITSIPQGNYIGTITFVYNGQTFNVIVNLSVFDFLNTTLYNGGYYFTHNDDILNFHSNRDDTYIDIKMTMKIYDQFDNYIDYIKKFELPLFLKQNVFHPGFIVNQMMNDFLYNAQMFGNMYPDLFKKSSVDIEIVEKDYFGNEYFSASIVSLKYFKGRKNQHDFPFSIFLTDISKVGRIYADVDNEIVLAYFTKNTGYMSFGYISTDMSVYSKNFLNNKQNIFLYKVKLQHLEQNVGNDLTVFSENNAIRYVLFEKPEFFSKIKFINSFGFEEWISFSGKYEVRNEPVKKDNKTGRFLYEEKINFLIENKAKIKLNTGKIFTHELPIIVRIMNLPFVWLSYDDEENVKVRCLTKKIVTKPYDDGMISLDLEFEIIENTNDTIY